MSLTLALTSGALVTGGAALVGAGMRRRRPSLIDVMRRLDGTATAERTLLPTVTPATRRLLVLTGHDVGSWRRGQLLATALCAAAGLLLGALWTMLGLASPLVTGWWPVVGAALGFGAPVALLRGRAKDIATDVNDALFTFVDLVTLERLANRSGPQSLAGAAAMTDAPVFVAVRQEIERARMEQRPPYSGLARLGRELDLPILGEVADVMRLDESGAALSSNLRARVKTLRNAHVNAELVRAHAVNERLTIWMVLPAMVFGLVFLVPPLLRMAS